MNPSYKPIDCDFYDYLEIYALHKELVSIQYLSFEGITSEVEDVIIDLRIVDNAEWVFLKKNPRLRADQILKIGDHINPVPPRF